VFAETQALNGGESDALEHARLALTAVLAHAHLEKGFPYRRVQLFKRERQIHFQFEEYALDALKQIGAGISNGRQRSWPKIIQDVWWIIGSLKDLS
jgi:hypothetical protein